MKVESVFLPPDHELSACITKGLAASYLTQTDGVLFFEKDSKIRVTPPRGGMTEKYHLHLIHRVAGEELDYVAMQEKNGLLELDLYLGEHLRNGQMPVGFDVEVEL